MDFLVHWFPRIDESFVGIPTWTGGQKTQRHKFGNRYRNPSIRGRVEHKRGNHTGRGVCEKPLRQTGPQRLLETERTLVYVEEKECSETNKFIDLFNNYAFSMPSTRWHVRSLRLRKLLDFQISSLSGPDPHCDLGMRNSCVANPPEGSLSLKLEAMSPCAHHFAEPTFLAGWWEVTGPRLMSRVTSVTGVRQKPQVIVYHTLVTLDWNELLIVCVGSAGSERLDFTFSLFDEKHCDILQPYELFSLVF